MNCINQPVDVLPPHTPDEVAALYEDLRADKRLKVPVIIDENGEIIDGRLRARLCEDLKIDWRPTATVESGLTADEKAALRIKLNLLRRNTPPTAEQKRKYMEVILKAESHLSNGEIAKLCGFDHSTISRNRKKLEEAGEIQRATTATGSDNITRRKPERKERPKPIPEQVPQAAAEATEVTEPEAVTCDPGQSVPTIKIAEQEIEPAAEEPTPETSVGHLECLGFKVNLIKTVSERDGYWEWMAQDDEGNSYHLTCKRMETVVLPTPMSKVG